MILKASMEGPNQTAQKRSLIRTFAVRISPKTSLREAWPNGFSTEEKNQIYTYFSVDCFYRNTIDYYIDRRGVQLSNKPKGTRVMDNQKMAYITLTLLYQMYIS